MSVYIPPISDNDILRVLLLGLCEACCIEARSCNDTSCKDCLFESDNLKDNKDKFINYLVDKGMIDKTMAMRLTLGHEDE